MKVQKVCITGSSAASPLLNESIQAFYKEAVLWRFLRHRNVVRFLGVSATMDLCLISEWMPNGTLTSFVSSHPDADRISLVRLLAQCIATLY